MLVGLFGTPSPLADWTKHAVQTIMRCIRPNYHLICPSSFDELRTQWNAIPDDLREDILLCSDVPDKAICELFVSTGCPIIFVADQPEDIIASVMVRRNWPFEPAVRLMTQSISALSELFHANNLLRLHTDQYNRDARSFIIDIITHLDYDAQSEHLETILFQIVTNYQPACDSTIGDQVMRHVAGARPPGGYEPYSPDQRAVLDQICPPFDVLSRKAVLTEVSWPLEIFYNPDGSSALLKSPQSMLGKARMLMYGPYLHLPRGHWKVGVEIEIHDNYSGNIIRSDILLDCREVLTGIKAQLPTSGIFAFSMEFEVSEPRSPLELRIEMLQGAIEGFFAIRGVDMRRIGFGRSHAGRIIEGAGHAAVSAVAQA